MAYIKIYEHYLQMFVLDLTVIKILAFHIVTLKMSVKVTEFNTQSQW